MTSIAILRDGCEAAERVAGCRAKAAAPGSHFDVASDEFDGEDQDGGVA